MTDVTESDVPLPDGRTVHAFDTGPVPRGLTILWHHGSPQTGALLVPLLAAAAARDIRLCSAARPSYGGSTPDPGRSVADAAADLAHVADALGIGRFAVMGASGGGPHAIACAALMPDRVVGAAVFASPAPDTGDEAWFDGMADPSALRAARLGRAARAAHPESDDVPFVQADWDSLAGVWADLGRDVGRSAEWGDDGLIDDDVAFASPWGVDLATVAAPVLLAHGGLDAVIPLAHSRRLLDALPDGELWLRPRDSHVSILETVPVAMDWLRAR